jgi:hypothetical protein
VIRRGEAAEGVLGSVLGDEGVNVGVVRLREAFARDPAALRASNIIYDAVLAMVKSSQRNRVLG